MERGDLFGVEWSMPDEQSVNLHVPEICPKCGGKMIFQGVGEYKCDRCGFLDYDDYGKIRLCVENNPGVNIAEAEQRTGVDQRTIRRLLKDGRLMLAEDSKIMMHCEKCGKRIRSGRFCPECETKLMQRREAQERSHSPHSDMRGYAVWKDNSKGEKRYNNDGGNNGGHQ